LRNFILLPILIAGLLCGGCDPSSTDRSSQPAGTDGADNSASTSDAQSDEPEGGADDSADVPVKTTDAAAEEPAETGPPIRTPDELVKALAEKNADFGGQLKMEAIGENLVSVAINDRKVTDISPLARLRIGVLDLSQCDVADLSPLKGQPLMGLYIEGNSRLSNIEALRGMPLREIYFNDTRVNNLGPLRGAPLEQVNLVGTRVSDVSPLSESPIGMLWLSFCPVKDISPLKKCPLVSLTVEKTQVEDISPLAGQPIQRLHIGGCNVSDLTPLKQMRLTRLVFAPGNVKKGIEAARLMPTMTEIGTTFETRMRPAEFWKSYDAGEIE
jgi:internalin A